VLAAIEAGASQVLIVGAGFDTLSLRRAPEHPEVHFFELDHPATSAAKRKGVRAEGKPPNMTMISADLAQVKLSSVMADQADWDPRARSVLVVEGLLMYLSDTQVRDLFREAATCTGPGSRLALTHVVDLDLLGPVARLTLKALGEPWLSQISRAGLGTYLGEVGWRLRVQNEQRSEREFEAFAVAELPG